jgi:hypothetical protein
MWVKGYGTETYGVLSHVDVDADPRRVRHMKLDVNKVTQTLGL